MNDDDNKREYSRIPKSASIEVLKIEYPMPTNAGQTAKSKDITEGGVCLIMPQAHTTGTMLSVKVDLKGWRQHLKNVAFKVDEDKARAPLTVVAEVVWCKPLTTSEEYEIGMKFLDIYEDDLVALNNYLDSIRESST